jgi:hypothetical protein
MVFIVSFYLALMTLATMEYSVTWLGF